MGKTTTKRTDRSTAKLLGERLTKMNSTVDQIASELLDLETLETRGRDSLDFHDLAVWSIKAALEAAYKAGQAERAIEVGG